MKFEERRVFSFYGDPGGYRCEDARKKMHTKRAGIDSTSKVDMHREGRSAYRLERRFFDSVANSM